MGRARRGGESVRDTLLTLFMDTSSQLRIPRRRPLLQPGLGPTRNPRRFPFEKRLPQPTPPSPAPKHPESPCVSSPHRTWGFGMLQSRALPSRCPGGTQLQEPESGKEGTSDPLPHFTNEGSKAPERESNLLTITQHVSSCWSYVRPSPPAPALPLPRHPQCSAAG